VRFLDASFRCVVVVLVGYISGGFFRAYERFTGSQVLKIATEQPAKFHDTERVSLVTMPQFVYCNCLLVFAETFAALRYRQRLQACWRGTMRRLIPVTVRA
jgi:hypothetical protein